MTDEFTLEDGDGNISSPRKVEVTTVAGEIVAKVIHNNANTHN
jgi:hypothetical protein